MAQTYRSTRIEGLDQLKANLDALSGAMETKIGAKADHDAAQMLADALHEAAPYAPEGSPATEEYGHLRENIVVRKQRSRKPHVIAYVVGIGASFWGRLVELGTVKMPAHPWMRPTFDRLGDALRDKQIQGLRDGIADVARKAERTLKRFGG